MEYDNEAAVRQMIEYQQDMMIPSGLIPKCPKCGRPMTMNLRSDNTFVQDDGWYAAAARYERFIKQNSDAHVLFLELGVGGNTPVIIKYPFMQMTYPFSGKIHRPITSETRTNTMFLND